MIGEADIPGGWRAVVDASPVAHALVSLPGSIVAANQAFFELFGLPPGDLGSIDALTLAHPDDRAATRAGLGRLQSGELRTFATEKRYLRPDGSAWWGRMHITLVPSDDDRSLLLGTCIDISDEVQGRAIVEGHGARARALLEQMSDVVSVVDPAGTVLYVSQSVEELVGLTPDEVEGSSCLFLVHEDDLEIVGRRLFPEPGHEQPQAPLRFRVRRADGTVILVEGRAVNLLDDPLIGGLVLIVRRVDEPTHAVSAQELLRRRYQRMLEDVADHVSVVGSDGEPIEELGPGRSTDLGRERWSATDTIDRCHPEHRGRLVRSMLDLFATPDAHIVERFPFSDGRGGWFTLEFEGTNRTNDPAIGATVITTRDVTEQEVAARELAEARDQALQALQARSEFLATVSHELRTPIHGILGLSELLGESDDAQTRRISGAIYRSAETLRLVVDDILDLSTLEAGRLEIVPAPMDIVELRDDLTTLFRTNAEAKAIGFDVAIDDDFPEWAWGDGLRVRQIISNLIANAIKFTDEGGVSVRVTAEAATPPFDTEQVVRITVSDTGIGVPADVQRDLFRPFSRAHARTATRYGGTGLGLAITDKLVEALSGTLTWESREGEGSTFSVVFPLAPLEVDSSGSPIVPADLAAPATLEPAVPDDREILVVEDNPVNQLLVARQLEVLGFRPAVVADGESALTRFLDHPPAAVLMDLRLPGIDGLAAAQQIRLLEARHHLEPTPIVAMTASGLAGDRDRAADVGMDGFLSKPVGLAELREALATWCRLDRSGGALADALGDPGQAVVDTTTADLLVAELDDPDLVAHLCELFVRELPARCEAIIDAVSGGDPAARRAASHALRSAGLTLGATALVELCERIETDGETGGAADGDVLEELEQLSRATAHQLTALAGRYRARSR